MKTIYDKKLFIYVIVLASFLPCDFAFCESIEAKGRIKWEMLKLEKKRLELEDKKLRLEITRLEINACDRMYKSGTGERIACVKRAMQHLTIPGSPR